MTMDWIGDSGDSRLWELLGPFDADRLCKLTEDDIESTLLATPDERSRQNSPWIEKKTIFDDSGDQTDDKVVDFEGWSSELPKGWKIPVTIDRFFSTGVKSGQLYREDSPELAMPEKELDLISKQDFLNHDCRVVDKLYDVFDEESEESKDSFEFPEYQHDLQKRVRTARKNRINRRWTRKPRNHTSRRTREVAPKLWEFIRDLLFNPQFCPRSIRWENYEERTFRFIDNQEIAKHWGARKRNENMNFEKFSRLIRYYYKKEILEPVPNRPLVYKFGSKASGIETENPNFESIHCTR